MDATTITLFFELFLYSEKCKKTTIIFAVRKIFVSLPPETNPGDSGLCRFIILVCR
jgi:hypothetical protein